MTKFYKSEFCVNCDNCNNNVALFKGLNEELVEKLNASRYEVRFKAGENIIKQGMPANHLILVTHGLVKLFIEGVNDKNLILELLGTWGVFGSHGMFTDHRYHYTGTAVTDTTTCFIDVSIIREAFRMDPVFAENFISTCSSQNTLTFERMVSLTQKQMHGRMADALIYLSNSIYKSKKFELQISKQDLAEMTAMTKDSAVRILKELSNEKIIAHTDSKFTILDMNKLEELAKKG